MADPLSETGDGKASNAPPESCSLPPLRIVAETSGAETPDLRGIFAKICRVSVDGIGSSKRCGGMHFG